jgi:hypothetical protein
VEGKTVYSVSCRLGQETHKFDSQLVHLATGLSLPQCGEIASRIHTWLNVEEERGRGRGYSMEELVSRLGYDTQTTEGACVALVVNGFASLRGGKIKAI